MKLKTELNAKNKEINNMKVEFNILFNEDKKKLKIIEEILLESGKPIDEIIDIIEGKDQSNKKLDISANNYIKLREVYRIKNVLIRFT